MDVLLRVLGGIALALFVWLVDSGLTGNPAPLTLPSLALAVGSGFVLGLLVTPDLTLKPLVQARKRLVEAPDAVLAGGVAGLLVALVASALLAVPLSLLPSSLGRFLPIAACLLLVYLGVMLGITRGQRILERLGMAAPTLAAQVAILVDTSAIIDGRLLQIRITGFLHGSLLVPDFVVDELQRLADSSNATVRARGRRGLDVLRELRQLSADAFEIVSYPDVPAGPVDSRLVAAAQAHHLGLITTDANLARVAELHQVPVYNVHALSQALRSQLLPGEQARVRVVQEGSEPNQGRAYLPDGTLVVIEGGRRFIGRELDVVISRSLQTAQGHLFFAEPASSEAESVS